MKAIVYTKYGPPEVLQLKEVPRPIPQPNELLIRTHAVFVGTEDIIQRKGKPYFGRLLIGLHTPKRPILGTEFCGTIEEAGNAVTMYRPGDTVCGVTGARFGCYAEYVCVPETGLLRKKPPNMTAEEAAPICGSLAAWNLLKNIARISKGQKVLILCAYSSLGLAAVQIASLSGSEVTGVCGPANADVVRAMGADSVISSEEFDLAKSCITYDVILDASGRPSSMSFKHSLASRGVYLTTYPTMSILWSHLWTSLWKGRRVVFAATAFKPLSERLAFLEEVGKLLAEGKMRTIVERSFELEQMREAHRYIESRAETGNVVVTL